MVTCEERQITRTNGAVAAAGPSPVCQAPGGQSAASDAPAGHSSGDHSSASHKPAGLYWAWVGAHGGAGVTTLAEAVPGGADFGRDFPAEVGVPGLPAVVVCRANAQGLVAAREAAAKAASLAEDVLGLVVVADMPERRRPKPLAEALYLTRGAYPELWEMPWVPAWRFGEPPAPANSPRQVRELLVDLWTALDLPLPGGKSQMRQAK
jgi:hypothetical protein